MALGIEKNWIWINHLTPQDLEEPILVLFRKKVKVEGNPVKAEIQITADSRYKLYVNGMFAEMGPSRGDRHVWYYDTIDISPYLVKGENVIAVQVLRYPLNHDKGNHGIFRTDKPGLFIRGSILEDSGKQYIVDTDASWKCRKSEGFRIVSESDIFAPLQIYESVTGESELQGWMLPKYDDTNWSEPFFYGGISAAVSPGNMEKRTIPYLYRAPRRFDGVITTRNTGTEEAVWEKLIRQDIAVTIDANRKEIVELSASVERTGYLHLEMLRGAGAKIRIIQAESYIYGDGEGWLKIKGKRDDWEGGYLDGFFDDYKVSGHGTAELPEIYEPFWFRTFRFVKLEIETADTPITIQKFNYEQTGYPLEVKTSVVTSDESMEKIWEISRRSLENCMHETYEDCPYYEQLQYAMDSRSQILYTYAVSADDRLARKCMDDFRRSQRYDGLLNCSYPNFGPNVIPTFSIFYIMMLYDHMMYFGDRELLESHMATADRILEYFHTNRSTDGYVEKIGGLNGPDRFWSFIDWTPEWDSTNGVPSATLDGAITMESLLYVMGLQHAAKIASYIGNSYGEKKYLDRAKDVQKALLDHCMSANGMLSDGPSTDVCSQHVQVFALLTDTIDIETGKKNLLETIEHKEQYAQCSVAMAYYLYRALEKADLYEYTDEYWNIWRRMIAKGATTCVEDEIGERSECHAWGALALYEIPSVVLGVRPAAPGYEKVSIRPIAGKFNHASGHVITPKGMVDVSWERDENGDMKLEYHLPQGLEISNYFEE